MRINKRDFLKQFGIGTAAVGSLPRISAATADADEPIEKLAVDVASNERREMLAFTSYEQDTLCLYVATGTSDVDAAADEVNRLTDPEDGSIWDIAWKDSSTLSYWKNGEVYESTVGKDGVVTQETFVEEQLVPGGTVSGSSEGGTTSPDQIIAPPGGGGSGDPDWFDDPDYDHDPIERCKHITTLGVEWVDFCFKTNSISPKYYTKSCTGYEQPLVGASVSSISITTPAGGGSLGLDLWFGVDPETECMYWGSEAANVCMSNCNLGLNATLDDVEDAFMTEFENAFETASDELSNIAGLPWASYAKTILKILATIAALIFFAVITIASGGSVTS